MSEDTGTVVTVEGRIDPEELGVTLPHEHLFGNAIDSLYEPPDSAVERRIAEEPISLENYWWVRRNPWNHKDNLVLDSFDDAVEEVGHYHRAGGDAIVDVSPKGTGRNPEDVRAVARETGVTFVHGTAFYTRDSHPDRVAEMTADEIANEFVADVREGIGETELRAGIVGEIGITGYEQDNDAYCDWIHPQEEKVLRSGVRAALRTGASVSVHPPSKRDPEYPTSRRTLEVLDVASEEGLPMERLILCHRDQSKWQETDRTYRSEMAERGAYVEFDLFGHDDLYHAAVDDAQPSDLDRVKALIGMIEDGYADRMLLSHDVFLKYLLKKYGGYGYSHILENIVPLLKEMGVERSVIDTMLVENPRRVLTFQEPES
jgi:phosphotriesterase-related protein